MKCKFGKDDFKFALKEFCRSFKRIVHNIKDPITVTQYVEGNRIMPQNTPFPGAVDMELNPYLKEIQDNFSSTSGVNEVAFMKCAQIGATFAVENIIVYLIGHAPCPILYTSANQSLLEKWSNKRLEAAIKSCDLESRIFVQIEKRGSKRTGDKILSKEFSGGSLDMASMQSAPGLRSDSIKALIMDELDGAPIFLKGEGDPRAIAKARTRAWGARKKILYISTPTTTEESKINELYLTGDQRKYFVPCPHCGHFQALEWVGLKFKRDDDKCLIKGSVYYECVECKKEIREHHKRVLLRGGEWRPTAKAKKRGFRSYHINALYSPPGMDDWESIVENWLESKNEPNKLRSFINLILGEPFVERGEAPSYEKVLARKGGYHAGTVPEESLCMTMGADIQKNRIECEVVAWGARKRSWSVAYYVFKAESGDVELDDINAGCWEKLKELLINGISGQPIQMSFIDSGYATGKVYEFCAQFSAGVYPVMGEGRAKYKRRQIITPRNVTDYDVVRYDLNTDMLKDEVAAFLRKETPLEKGNYPAGFCHFPEEYGPEYFKQLTAEEKFLKQDANGNKFYVWLNRRNRANEALDCRCYNLAALYLLASFVCDEVNDENEGNISWKTFWDSLQSV